MSFLVRSVSRFSARRLPSASMVRPAMFARAFAAEPEPWWMKRPYPKASEEDPVAPSEELVQASEASGIPVEQIADPQLHFWTMRAETLLDELNVPEADRDAWLEKNLLSPGHFTLEWALPSPPPVHCYTEIPIIKESH